MATYKNKKLIIDGKTYSIGISIGSGGNGCVCCAKVEGEVADYAVKFLAVKVDENNYEQKRERFMEELRFCEESSHPNIVKVYGHGEFEGRPCYVMKRYPKTLKKVIEEEKDIFLLLKYLEQLCEAVKFIHKKGVIHRDIKPENIFIDNCGQVLLADFGIAHFVDSSLTSSGDWLGNKSYAAPEQLAKGYATKVTTACDIYSIGLIINEVFTKVKPSGSKHMMIYEVEPILYSIDDLVYRCMLQNPVERPEIEEVLAEITLIKGEIEQEAENFLDNTFVDELLTTDEINNILNKACKDVIAAKYIFQRVSDEEIDRYNCNYHRDIRYNISKIIKNLLFQKNLYEACLDMFNYESNVYSTGSQYVPLNLKKPQENAIYKKFESIVLKREIGKLGNDLTGKILKLFSSCCNYHCDELLEEIEGIEKFIADLDDAPILYIVYVLRKTLDDKTVREIDLIDHVEINWKTTSYDELEEGNLYKAIECGEEHVLEKMQEEWGIIWSRIDLKHFSVKFIDKESYHHFRTYALRLAKPYYVFEGDVLEVLRIKRKHSNIIELEPLNSFDVSNVLAKILGMRDDY